jgi:hypothetical protein
MMMMITAAYVDNFILAWSFADCLGFEAVNKPLNGGWIILV